MHKTSKLAYANIIQFILDFIFLILAFSTAYLLSSLYMHLNAISEYFWVVVVFIPLWLSSMTFLGMYNKTTFHYPDRIFRNILISTIYSGVLLLALFFFVKERSVSRVFIADYFILCVAIMFVQRFISGYLYRTFQIEHPATTRVVIVGSPETAKKFHYYLGKTDLRCYIVGYVQVGKKPPVKGKLNLGTLDNLEKILKNNVVDEVIFALSKDYVGEVEGYVQLCETMGLTVRILVNLFDLQFSRVHTAMLGTIPMLTFHSVSLNNLQRTLKRVIDFLGAVVGLVLTGIASIFIIPAIKLDSPGPILFKQTRVGLYGRKFTIYKFRSMSIDAEEQKKKLAKYNEHGDGKIFKIKDDPRITRVGKFLRKTSLDELPQFLNVLKGDMSLVGTRPPLVDEVEKYETNHWRRISIKPGITGMWQVSGRSSIKDFDHIVELDTQYIDNWSVGLDLNILLKTVGKVIWQKSAY